MPSLRVLITGGSGFLGQYLNQEIAKENDILTLFNNHKGNCGLFKSAQTDIMNYSLLDNLFETFKPQITVHTAAISSPVAVHSTAKELIYNTNVNATLHIARLCEKYKSRLIYTSTDLVYAGSCGSMLKEDSRLMPASLYAATKLEGEVKITETFDDYIILRTATLYGIAMNEAENHFSSVYHNLKAGRKVKLFTDQYRTPLSSFEAARIINDLVRSDVRQEIINFGGIERVSRLELGERLCNIAGFDKSLIEKISMDDLPDYPRVADVSMHTG